ncbi:MAG: hypothetical protein K6A71_06875 [Lachnospiraceae bacterium]|nr:hypothetical protein [Lachnospiraceae bacterium]
MLTRFKVNEEDLEKVNGGMGGGGVDDGAVHIEYFHCPKCDGNNESLTKFEVCGNTATCTNCGYQMQLNR